MKGYTRDRYYSTYRKNLTSGQWATNLGGLESKVREYQMKLVELANETGDTRSIEVLKYQRQLIIKLEFRILAVHKATTNKGHKTPGIDQKVIETDEEKWETVE